MKDLPDTWVIDSHVHFPGGCEKDPDCGRRLIESAMPFRIGGCVVSHIFCKGEGEDLYYPSPAAVCRANFFAAEQMRKNPGRLYFMGYINPQNPDWKAEMDRCIAWGACGFKLWVSLKDPFGRLDRTIQVLQYAAALGKSVYLHVFNRTGGNLCGEICMEELLELAQSVPNCRMIAGHTGGNWRKSAQVVRSCPDNVWMETGGSNPDHCMVDGILKFCAPEHLLYGSDGPGRAFYPQIRKVLESSLSASDREKVFCKNAASLLGIPEPMEGELPVVRYQTPPGPAEIDYCCFCGRYPFEERPHISAARLEKVLEEAEINEAYCVDLETVFSPEGALSRKKFLQECAALSRVKPLYALDVTKPDRDDLLNEIVSEDLWQGIWLSPAFHRWKLDDTLYRDFLQRCVVTGKKVFVNCMFYESRFFDPALQYRAVSDEELCSFLEQLPFKHCIIQGKNPFPGAERYTNCSWCYTNLSDFGTELSRAMKKTLHLVRGSEFPFRHPEETWKAACYRMDD